MPGTTKLPPCPAPPAPPAAPLTARPLRAASRASALASLAVLVALATLVPLAACGAASRAATPDRAVLEVRCPVADAVLWVDGRYVAQVRDLRGGLSLLPGHHQIELRHERYHAYYGDLDIAAGQRLRIDVPLAEALP